MPTISPIPGESGIDNKCPNAGGEEIRDGYEGKIRNEVEREEDGGIKEGTSSASVVNEKENRIYLEISSGVINHPHRRTKIWSRSTNIRSDQTQEGTSGDSSPRSWRLMPQMGGHVAPDG